MSTRNYYDKCQMTNADLTDNPLLFKKFYWVRVESKPKDRVEALTRN